MCLSDPHVQPDVCANQHVTNSHRSIFPPQQRHDNTGSVATIYVYEQTPPSACFRSFLPLSVPSSAHSHQSQYWSNISINTSIMSSSPEDIRLADLDPARPRLDPRRAPPSPQARSEPPSLRRVDGPLQDIIAEQQLVINRLRIQIENTPRNLEASKRGYAVVGELATGTPRRSTLTKVSGSCPSESHC